MYSRALIVFRFMKWLPGLNGLLSLRGFGNWINDVFRLFKGPRSKSYLKL